MEHDKFIKLEQFQFLGIGTNTQLYSKATINSAPEKAGAGSFIDFVENKPVCPESWMLHCSYNCTNCGNC